MAFLEPVTNIHAKRDARIRRDRLAVGFQWINSLCFQSSSSGVRQLAVGEPEASFWTPKRKMMPDFNELYRKHNEQMEDFWSRRANAPKYERTIRIFGHPVIFDSNLQRVLDSANIAEQMYSTLDSQTQSTWRVHLTVRSESKPAPPPERLLDLVQYTGTDDWLSIDLLEWGNC